MSAPSDQLPVTASVAAVTRAQLEDFLYREAALLDSWQLDSWLELFCEDAVYVMPSADLPDGDPTVDQVYIDDTMERLRARVTRLKSRRAFREFPYARTRRLITNVVILGRSGDEIELTASFAVYRFRNRQADVYVGRYDHRLRLVDGDLRYVVRRSTLDLEDLRPHGTVSIIV
ncbi:MAG: aromatic-ring-hydroxylating dioxygenase subunit beta [Actinomycetota bacterium]|nr:MAG: aromatic-ring-hydroxylating dioxygenase subunit beta [Actinomycetota bacterium]